MATPMNETGVLKVNGTWVTRVTYVASLQDEKPDVQLRFLQGRAEVSRVSLVRDQLGEVLGPKNQAAIERHIASEANPAVLVVKGELKGRQLHYREVTVASRTATQENSIAEAPLRIEPATVDEGRAKATGDSTQPANEPAEPPTSTDAQDRAKGPRAAPAVIPAHIASKYLVSGNTYHFEDQSVAFVDAGSKLTAQTHNKAIIQDLVAIAKAREWQGITVTGTREFRREVWKEAVTAGLAVEGYRASALEQAAVERERARRQPTSSPEPSASRESYRAAAAPKDPEEPPHDAPSRPPDSDIRYGTLVAHGAAPYRHDATQSMSYFVTLKDPAGNERTSWGVGLETAIRESKTAVQVNDVVGIRRGSSTPVTVQTRTVSEEGEIVMQPINAKRHAWQVEKASWYLEASSSAQRTEVTAAAEGRPAPQTDLTPPSAGSESRLRDKEAAAAIRSARTTREELQLKYPDLNKAVFQHLASHDQFAEAFVKAGLIRESDRAQVIAQMRERLAGQLDRGTRIREPDNKQVDTLIRRSVDRVAADIGRAPVKVDAAIPEQAMPRPPIVREEAQVRA